MKDAMQDIRECWAQSLGPGTYCFRDPVLDHPEPEVPVTPAPEADDPESLL